MSSPGTNISSRSETAPSALTNIKESRLRGQMEQDPRSQQESSAYQGNWSVRPGRSPQEEIADVVFSQFIQYVESIKAMSRGSQPNRFQSLYSFQNFRQYIQDQYRGNALAYGIVVDLLDNFGPMYSLREFDKLRERYHSQAFHSGGPMSQFPMFRPPGGARGVPKPKKAEKKNTDIFGDGPAPRSPGLQPPADGELEGGLGLADT